jgi:Uncharacterised nucleotidyltransferase
MMTNVLVPRRKSAEPVSSGRGWTEQRSFRSPLVRTRSEARFVTLAVREPDTLERGELLRAAEAVSDWWAVAVLAARHGVAAYVREAAARAALVLPTSAAHALQSVERVALATVMGIDVELARLVEALSANGVPTTVLKGPALARTIYPRRSLRPYGDIDLTIQDQHRSVAARILAEHGYAERAYAAEEARRAHSGDCAESTGFHRQFTSSDDRVLVDLHADPLQLGLRPTCEVARWRRAVAVPGLPGALMLCPEDQVVQLSTHLHKHGFERLIWLKDIDVLLRARQDCLNWDLVHRVARAEGVQGSVWYTLLLSQALLATPVPPEVLRHFRPSAPLRMLYEWVWPMTRITDLEGFMRRRAVQFHAAESWRGALPGLILMGRRADRARAAVHAMQHLVPGLRHESAH